MEFTGERPTVESHLESSRLRYKATLPFCAGKRVLDYGCGIGHGSFMLSRFVKSVTAYDPSPEAVSEARRLFQAPNLRFTDGLGEKDLLDIDIVVSIECIEHMPKEQVEKALGKFRERIPSIVCTTPDGDFFPYHPRNESEHRGFHLWHYTEAELRALFGRFYSLTEVQGVAFDPALGRFTGYLVYGSNALAGWNDKWLSEAVPGA